MWSISPQRDTSSFCRPMAGVAVERAGAASGERCRRRRGGGSGREHRVAPFIGLGRPARSAAPPAKPRTRPRCGPPPPRRVPGEPAGDPAGDVGLGEAEEEVEGQGGALGVGFAPGGQLGEEVCVFGA